MGQPFSRRLQYYGIHGTARKAPCLLRLLDYSFSLGKPLERPGRLRKHTRSQTCFKASIERTARLVKKFPHSYESWDASAPAPNVDHGDHAADGGSRSNVRESGPARFLLGKVRTPGGEGMVGVRAKRRLPASCLETKNKRGTSNVFGIAFRTASAASFGSLAARQYRHH
jgi:hypothetical protein